MRARSCGADGMIAACLSQSRNAPEPRLIVRVRETVVVVRRNVLVAAVVVVGAARRPVPKSSSVGFPPHSPPGERDTRISNKCGAAKPDDRQLR
jgi:hypothetical protein